MLYQIIQTQGHSETVLRIFAHRPNAIKYLEQLNSLMNNTFRYHIREITGEF